MKSLYVKLAFWDYVEGWNFDMTISGHMEWITILDNARKDNRNQSLEGHSHISI